MTDLETIISAGKQLPEHHPNASTREAIRTSLLRTDDDASVKHPRRSHLVVAATIVGVAAAAAIAWFSLRTSNSALVDGVEPARAVLSPSLDAQLEHRRVISPTDDGVSVDEVVRLSNGSVSVAVKKLRPFERFRVITGDAEVEVRGTAFSVIVERDKLVGVAVDSGLVEVRPWQQGPILLAAGERWAPSLGKHTSPEASPTEPPHEVEKTAHFDAGTKVANSPPPTVETLSAAQAQTQALEPTIATRVTRKRVAATSKGESSGGKKHPEAAEQTKALGSPPADVLNSRAVEASLSSSNDDPVLAPRARPPTKAERAFSRGYRALSAGAYDTAARDFERVVALDPQSAVASDARYWRAVALARSKKQGPARNALQQFLRLHPKSARVGSASVMLGWILVEMKQLESARRLFRVGKRDPRRDVASSARKGLRAIEDASK